MIRATRSATGYNEKQWRRGVAAWHHSPLSGICTHYPFFLSLSFSFSLSFCLSIFLSMWHMCVQPYDEHPLVSWKIVVGRGRYPLSLLLLFRRANQPPFFCMFRIRNCHFRLGKNCYALIVWIVIFLNCLKIALFEDSFETLYFDQS
jgi:hypothetical protein